MKQTQEGKKKTEHWELDYQELKARLGEAEDTLRAIRSGEVDALVLRTSRGEQVFTLSGADKPYRILVERMQEGAATLDEKGIIMYANSYLAEMLKTHLEMVVGSPMIPFIIPEMVARFRMALINGKQRASRGEYSLLAKTDEIVPVYLSLSPVILEGAPGICFLATDLREQKLLESSRKEVEKQKIERDLRKTFVSILSHDLLNPLAAAKNRLEVLRRNPEISELSQQLAKAMSDIDRVDHMIRDFLNADRVQANDRYPLKIEEGDLAKIIQEAIADMTMVRGCRFVLRGPPSLPGFWSQGDLRRAIENLMDNAVKYGSSVEPVTVALEQTAESVFISVHNQGNLIAARDQGRIFGDFVRKKSAAAGQQTGWGLGLSLVRQVAEAHGGSVSLKSEPTAGTTFTMKIPKDTRRFVKQSDCIEVKSNSDSHKPKKHE